MPRYKASERDEMLQETRQRLLAAAADEFAREGYNGANINRISRAAGFAKGTVYNHFASKEALMRALIADVAAAHVAFIIAAVRQERAPRRRLRRFFAAGFAFVSEQRARAQVMVNMLYGPDASFKQYMYEQYLPLFHFVAADIVAPGVAQGEFRPVAPDAMAQLLMTIYLGTGAQLSEEGRPWFDPDEVADFAWHGLRAHGSKE